MESQPFLRQGQPNFPIPVMILGRESRAYSIGNGLERLARTTEPVGPVIRSYRGSHLKANSVVNWFVALFKDLGYEGCSSHSGRRSFITIAARNIHRTAAA
jgi:hypothetical protein